MTASVHESQVPDGAAPSPPRGVVPRFDAVSLTVVAVALAMLVPARYTFSMFGSIGRPSVVLGLVLLFWWAVTRLVPGMAHHRGNPVRRWGLVFLVVFFTAFIAGSARSLPGVEARGLDRALLVYAGLMGVLLVVADGVTDRRRLDQLLRRVVGLGVALALLGHVQFITGTNLAESLQFPGTSLHREFFEVEARNAFTRVNATATHPIEFGVIMGMMLPIALHYALHARRHKALAWFAVVVIGSAGPISVSRSSIVAIAAGLVILVLGWNARRRAFAALLALPGIVVVQSVVPGLLSTFRGLFTGWGEDASIEYRTNDYDRIFELASESWLFGRGPGTFIPDYYFVVDNQYLVSLVETGIIGLAGIGALVLAAIWCCRDIRRRSSDAESRHLALALMAAYASAIIASGTYDSLAPAFGIFGPVAFALLGAAGALWRTVFDAPADLDADEEVPAPA